tara:strand:- start:121 stop:462 length:342 start_codon:yes stop_codon:yes gene_type:complete
MTDPLNPDYYKNYSIEVTDAIQSWGLNYCQGNIIKYIVRCGRKTADPTQDLEKALWYLQKELSKYDKQLSENSFTQSDKQDRSNTRQKKKRTPTPTRTNGNLEKQYSPVRIGT